MKIIKKIQTSCVLEIYVVREVKLEIKKLILVLTRTFKLVIRISVNVSPFEVIPI